MANEKNKDFNAMFKKKTDMPKTQIITDKNTIKKYGGEKMFLAPPCYYNDIMKTIPYGKIITSDLIRNYLAKNNNTDFTDPLTSGIFISICAWASHQREKDKIPYWRTLKTNGELNPKYPGGIDMQKKLLESEGHIIIQKGRKNIKYYVQNYENFLFELI